MDEKNRPKRECFLLSTADTPVIFSGLGVATLKTTLTLLTLVSDSWRPPREAFRILGGGCFVAELMYEVLGSLPSTEWSDKRDLRYDVTGAPGLASRAALSKSAPSYSSNDSSMESSLPYVRDSRRLLLRGRENRGFGRATLSEEPEPPDPAEVLGHRRAVLLGLCWVLSMELGRPTLNVRSALSGLRGLGAVAASPGIRFLTVTALRTGRLTPCLWPRRDVSPAEAIA
mmetsp:Transcript_35038/g.99315  ORF Transcript_35038/g.99315 Transcript_35038/m.99315 type:complete len:229 (-) Transcript_35038:1509-2195(-)